MQLNKKGDQWSPFLFNCIIKAAFYLEHLKQYYRLFINGLFQLAQSCFNSWHHCLDIF
jgi:hypothetical protein